MDDNTSNSQVATVEYQSSVRAVIEDAPSGMAAFAELVRRGTSKKIAALLIRMFSTPPRPRPNAPTSGSIQ